MVSHEVNTGVMGLVEGGKNQRIMEEKKKKRKKERRRKNEEGRP